RKYRRKHDGVEETDQNDGGYRNKSRSANPNQDTSYGTNTENGEQLGSLDALHHPGAGESPNHEPCLMRHKKKGGHFLRAVRNDMRQNARVFAFVVGKKLRTPGRHAVECLWHGVLHKPNNKAPHTHLRSHIEKLGEHALDQMWMCHHLAEAHAHPFFGIAGLARINLWKMYKINQCSNQE